MQGMNIKFLDNDLDKVIYLSSLLTDHATGGCSGQQN